MSLDFPVRADWLTYRRPRPNQPRLAFLSADVGEHTIKLAGGHEMKVPIVTRTATFNAGRNAEKLAARAEQAKFHADCVKIAPARGLKVRKRKISLALIDMLANRRLRQRQVNA